GEAWGELRHHKLRVLLSLIGIAVSVGAIAAVVALGDYQRQFAMEQSDRYGGRAATISVAPSAGNGGAMDWEDFDSRFQAVSERSAFTHPTRIVEQVPVSIQTPDYVREVMTRLVDPAHPVIHRSPIAEGRGFVPGDETLLAPPVVLSGALWEALGSPALAAHPTLTVTGPAGGVYQIIGVTPKAGPWDTDKSMTMLFDSYVARTDALPASSGVIWEVWVPPADAAAIGPVLAMDLRATAAEGEEISVARSDWGSRPEVQDQAMIFELVTGAIAGLVL